jgi:hypothetical protein
MGERDGVPVPVAQATDTGTASVAIAATGMTGDRPRMSEALNVIDALNAPPSSPPILRLAGDHPRARRRPGPWAGRGPRGSSGPTSGARGGSRRTGRRDRCAGRPAARIGSASDHRSHHPHRRSPGGAASAISTASFGGVAGRRPGTCGALTEAALSSVARRRCRVTAAVMRRATDTYPMRRPGPKPGSTRGVPAAYLNRWPSTSGGSIAPSSSVMSQ